MWCLFIYSWPFSLFFYYSAVLCLSFRVEPESVIQKQGGAVQLRCTARPATAKLSWLFQGRPLDPVLQPDVGITPGSLSLPSLQPALTGSYQCVAQSETGSIISRHARVSIAGESIWTHTDTHTLSLQLLDRSHKNALQRDCWRRKTGSIGRRISRAINTVRIGDCWRVLEGKETVLDFQSGTYPDTFTSILNEPGGFLCRAEAWCREGCLIEATPKRSARDLIRVVDKVALFSRKRMFTASHNPI